MDLPASKENPPAAVRKLLEGDVPAGGGKRFAKKIRGYGNAIQLHEFKQVTAVVETSHHHQQQNK